LDTKKSFEWTSFAFILYFIGLYIIWYFINEYKLFGVAILDEAIVGNLISSSEYLLDLMGYNLIDFSKFRGGHRAFGIDGSNGVYIGNACNGLNLFVLFSLFVLVYPQNIKRKIWFLPLGLIIIHILNILRITALSLISFYKPEYLMFNHTYTFTGIMYLVIFALWYWLTQKNAIAHPKS
jgi:exosortase family protein XrtF